MWTSDGINVDSASNEREDLISVCPLLPLGHRGLIYLLKYNAGIGHAELSEARDRARSAGCAG